MDDLGRRDALKLIAGAGVAAAAACKDASSKEPPMKRESHEPAAPAAVPSTLPSAVLAVEPLSFPWQTPDPFLFCVHHDDAYPAGNDRFGPAAPLHGRQLGEDFAGLDGWRMYHGRVVPGFPQHPHRGFETVTVVRRGLLDHSDSLGAAARYGRGDVQWLTAGSGILHAEMFPLLDRKQPNPLELFQIWLNLPRASKMVKPHFSMHWSDAVPRHQARDEAGRATDVTIVAGQLAGKRGAPPPPASWASRAEGDVAVWTLRMDPGARFTIPAAAAGSNRSLYFFRGTSLKAGGRDIPASQHLRVKGDSALALENGPVEAELLMLQGRPIGEPVVQYGPFVMNSREEIRQTILDYQRTQFGGWPWGSDDPVHGAEPVRFARHADGREEKPA